MATIVMEEGGDNEFLVLPPDSLIRVRVKGTKVEDKDGKYGPWKKLNFEFDIIEVLHPATGYEVLVGAPIWGGIPFRFTDHPDNQLKQWVEALFGLELKPGFELDTSNLVGREAKAVISNYPRKDGSDGHRVEALIAISGMGQAPQTTPQAPQPPQAPQAPQQETVASGVGGGSPEIPF